MGKERIEHQEVQPKRGRPSKSGALVIDGLMILSSEKRDEAVQLVAEITKTGEKVEALLYNAARKYYELGKIIDEVVKKLPARPLVTTQRVSDVTGIPARMTGTAFKIFKHFDGHPELLEGLTMREIALMISDKPEKEEGKKPRIEYGIPSGQLEFDGDETFGMPPLSGISLSNHRIRATEGSLYLIKKGINIPLEVIQMKINPPRDEALETAYSNLTTKMQYAVEEYYSAVEQVEMMEGKK
jgi:hypothetical protein